MSLCLCDLACELAGFSTQLTTSMQQAFPDLIYVNARHLRKTKPCPLRASPLAALLGQHHGFAYNRVFQ
jgi:hypothetical protein